MYLNIKAILFFDLLLRLRISMNALLTMVGATHMLIALILQEVFVAFVIMGLQEMVLIARISMSAQMSLTSVKMVRALTQKDHFLVIVKTVLCILRKNIARYMFVKFGHINSSYICIHFNN